jgi:hypothetical protein
MIELSYQVRLDLQRVVKSGFYSLLYYTIDLLYHRLYGYHSCLSLCFLL